MSIYELVTSMSTIICKWLRFKTSVLKSEDELQVWYILVSLSAENFCRIWGLSGRSVSGSFTSSSGSDDVGRRVSIQSNSQSFTFEIPSVGNRNKNKNAQKGSKAYSLLPDSSTSRFACSGSVRTLQEANEARYAISQQVLVHRITQFAAGIQFHVISIVWWLTCSQSVCLPYMVSLYKRLQVPGWLSEAGNGRQGTFHAEV